MLTNFLPFSYLGLHGYLQLHPGRLVYDMNQSPEKRPRMSTKTGTLQTLTTGVNALWSTTCSRIICQIPRSCTNTYINIDTCPAATEMDWNCCTREGSK